MAVKGPVVPRTYGNLTEGAPSIAPNPVFGSVSNNPSPAFAANLAIGEMLSCSRTGRMWILGYDSAGAVKFHPVGSGELKTFVRNSTGATLAKGKVVYITGSNGTDKLTVALADADTEATSSKTIGLVWENIANGADGFVMTEGLLLGVDTNSIGNAGDALYLSDVAGSVVTTKPVSPKHHTFIGWIVKKAGAGAGSIYVKVQNYPELEEMSDVLISSIADNDALVWDAATGVWRNEKVSYSTLQTVEDSSLLGRSNTGNGVAQEIKLSAQFVWGTAGSKPLLSIATTSDATKVDTSTQVNSGLGLTGGGDLTTSRTLAVDFATSGTVSSTKAVRADDARLSDARTPLAHTHTVSNISDIAVTSVSDKHVLQYSSSSSKWINVPQTDLVDGGNF